MTLASFIIGWLVGFIATFAWALIASYRAHARRRRKGIEHLAEAWLLADIRGDIGTRDRIEATMRDRYGVAAVKKIQVDDEQD